MSCKWIRIAALVIGLAKTVSAQVITVEREKVLGSFGTVTPVSVSVTPIAPGPGIVFTQTVSHSGASSLRLHFTIRQGAGQPFWTVVVTGTDGRRWEYSPTSAADTDMWSDEMPGDHATVQLMSTMKNPPVVLEIDRTAGTTQPTVPRSIVGDDQREPWNVQHDPLTTLGRSVVRLRFVDDIKKQVFVCTGWLAFSNRYVLTNDHCINSDIEAKSALADIDYNELATVPRSVRFRGVLMHDARLDFSLLELAQPLDRSPLSIGGMIAGNQALVVIEHPGGEPKQVSVRDCAIGVVRVPGTTSDATDFEHLCDTLGGSSGSPVFDAGSFSVVGLHHLGFVNGDKPVNRAVSIDLVVAAIRAKFPNVVKP